MRKMKTSTGWAVKHNGEVKRIVVTDDPRRNSAGRPTAAAVMLTMREAHYCGTTKVWEEAYREREYASMVLNPQLPRYASPLDAYRENNKWTLSAVEVVSYKD